MKMYETNYFNNMFTNETRPESPVLRIIEDFYLAHDNRWWKCCLWLHEWFSGWSKLLPVCKRFHQNAIVCKKKYNEKKVDSNSRLSGIIVIKKVYRQRNDRCPLPFRCIFNKICVVSRKLWTFNVPKMGRISENFHRVFFYDLKWLAEPIFDTMGKIIGWSYVNELWIFKYLIPRGGQKLLHHYNGAYPNRMLKSFTGIQLHNYHRRFVMIDTETMRKIAKTRIRLPA